MAVLKIQNQGLSFNLPEEGELFTQKGDLGTICRRVGNQLVCSEVGTFVTPEQGEQFKGKGGALQSAGLENLRRQGINIQSLPQYGDLEQAQREGILKFTGGLDVSNISTAITPTRTGEVFTKTISPINPYGSVITSNMGRPTIQSPALPVPSSVGELRQNLASIQSPTFDNYVRSLGYEPSSLDDEERLTFQKEYNQKFPKPIAAQPIQPIISPSSLEPSTPYDFKSYTEPPVPDVNALLKTPEIVPTAQEKEQSELLSRARQLTEKLLGESAFRTEQETKEGTPELNKTRQELTNQLNTLKNEAAAIPLQLQKEAAGRGITTTILGRQETARLRDNAIASLSVAAMLEATNGNLATANDLVDRAVKAKFDPIKEELAVLMGNLELIQKDPNTTIADKNRANAQLDIKRQQDLYVDLVKENAKQIWEVMTKAAANGANFTSTSEYPTLTQALTAINNSRTKEEAFAIATETGLTQAKEKLDTSVVEVGGRKLLIDNQTGKTIKDLGVSGISEGLSIENAPAGYVDAFNFLNARLSKDESVRATAYFNKLLSLGDLETAQEYLKSTAIANLPTTEQTKAFGRFAAIDSLNSIKQDLDDFISKGGNTGLLTGTTEAIAQKLGKTTNKELAKIGNEILLGMIAYRNAVSGAAFTESEQKQYIQVFPAIGKVPELNEAKIQALLDTFNRNNKSVFNQVLGAGNYDKVFKGEEKTGQQPSIPAEAEAVFDDVVNQPSGYWSKLWSSLWGK